MCVSLVKSSSGEKKIECNHKPLIKTSVFQRKIVINIIYSCLHLQDSDSGLVLHEEKKNLWSKKNKKWIMIFTYVYIISQLFTSRQDSLD